MGAQRVVCHELTGNLVGKTGIEAAADIDRRQLRVPARVVGRQLAPFPRQVGAPDVALGMDGHVFARRHGHRPGREP